MKHSLVTVYRFRDEVSRMTGAYIARFVIGSALCLALGACLEERYWYGFAFDLAADGQHAEALDYQYRYGKEILVGVPRQYVDAGRTWRGVGHGGNFPLGTAVYLKWRDTKTGKVYEETANIEGRLRGKGKQGNLDYSNVSLLIIENHLHVYLALHEERPVDMAPVGPAIYQPYKVYEIYPSDPDPPR